MHQSSYHKMRLFIETYGVESGQPGSKLKVLEIGSKRYHDQDAYRDFITDEQFDYTGLDLEAGENVTIVPESVYLWSELEDDTFDICISGQTFEHNPFFWTTMCEISRILKPGGYCCIIAPGSGHVHRYPFDCWRFYPDSWAPLCKIAGLEVVETYFETDRNAPRVSGGASRDSCVIARKPIRTPDETSKIKIRLKEMTKHYTTENTTFEPQPFSRGPCFERYESEIKDAKPVKRGAKAFFRRILGGKPASVFNPRNNL